MKGFLMLLGLLVVVVVAVVGLGSYMGWFHLTMSGTDSATGATITVDPDKIEADKKAAQEKMKELQDKAKDVGDKVKEKTNPATDKGKDEAPKP